MRHHISKRQDNKNGKFRIVILLFFYKNKVGSILCKRMRVYLCIRINRYNSREHSL